MDEVLVVGAGPVGLTVGIELFRRGVPCRVVDRLVDGAATSARLDGNSLPLIVDEAGKFQGAYGATGGNGYLVRPDGYVGFRAAPLTCADLRSHLEGVFAAQPVPGEES
jgi:hypothetical protein